MVGGVGSGVSDSIVIGKELFINDDRPPSAVFCHWRFR
jgi:hypothetical protein